MTREELDEILSESIVPKVEQVWKDLKSSADREEKLREELKSERGMRMKAEKDIAAKDKMIESKDREIERLNVEIANRTDHTKRNP